MAEMLNVCKDELFPSMSKVPLSPAGLYGWVLMEQLATVSLGQQGGGALCGAAFQGGGTAVCSQVSVDRSSYNETALKGLPE